MSRDPMKPVTSASEIASCLAPVQLEKISCEVAETGVAITTIVAKQQQL